MYNTDDELYKQHNGEIEQLVQIASAQVKTIEFDPCGFKKITVENKIFSNGKTRSILIFEDNGVSLNEHTQQPYEIIAGDVELTKKINIPINNYTHGKFCKNANNPLTNHAIADNVIPHPTMHHAYPFTDQAWFKEKK